ncbi:MAG TPA: delta-60 repeat domain-containing protein [Chthoniobacterales bacterium]|nr:delta-60 repeat domain-containing protein [Chthoniobacterales bacterium]
MNLTTSRIAAVSLLFGALAISVMAFTSTKSAIGSPGRPITQQPSGMIETDGTLDTTFNAGKFTDGLVFHSALQPDGKVIITGSFSEVHGVSRSGIARLNGDGTLDLSFDPGLGASFGPGDIVLQPDGKIIITGFFQTVSGIDRKGIARLNSDGSLDSGFDPGSVLSFDGTSAANTSIYGAVLQPDGKMVVFGQFFFVLTGPGTNVPRSCIARFNSDGTFDPSYNPGTGAGNSAGTFSTIVYHAARQNLAANAGKVVIAGTFETFDGHPVPGLARMNADGSFDATFTPGSAVDAGTGTISGLLAQVDDQILAFGYFDSFSGVARHSIVRLSASTGVVDSGFSTEEFEGYNYDSIIYSMAQQPDGKLIATGEFHSLGAATVNNVARLETNGARDTSFSGTGAGPSAWQINTALVRPSDGKIFLAGYFSSFGGQTRNNIAWANPDGSVDSSFAGLGGVAEYDPNIWTTATQADGKIIMTGVFTSHDGVPHNNVLRVNPDGTVDSSFDVHTDRSTRALLIQPDGKILIAGFFGEVNGVPMPRIARLNSDGSLDPSFDPGTGPDRYYIRALALDAAGNIYVGGEFSSFNGIPHTGVVKLTPTGAVDNVFNPANAGPFDLVFLVSAMTPPDSSGHIVIGGSFRNYNGTNIRGVARFDTTTGAIDSAFNAGGVGVTGNSATVFAVRQAPDGKYYVGGSFSSYNGVTRRALARLKSDGSLDTTFSGPLVSGDTVYSLAVQNGKVYVGGSNSSGPGIFVRLTDTGAVDSSLVTGTGFAISPQGHYPGSPAKISALNLQPDGKLLVGGIFNQYNGTSRICLARLTGPAIVPTPTPTPTPATLLGNISTRGFVGTGDNVMIAGFIITGNAGKRVTVRGIGPSLSAFGVSNPLADPVLELHGPAGFGTVINDNWRDSQTQCLETAELRPTNDLEAAICGATLSPGAYTAILRGKNNGGGVGLVEVYDVSPASDSRLANVSTRGFVLPGENVLIAGTILSGQGTQQLLVRGLGPSLGLPATLGDPLIRLYDANGALIRENNNWRDDQEAAIAATGLAPTNDGESAILETLPANGAAYTVILTPGNPILPGPPPPPFVGGVALVEIYRLP